MAVVVEFEKVSIRFGDNPVLDDLSFRVNKSDKVAITGPSGVGKTTVIRLISGFQVQDKGRISVFEKTLNEQNLRSVRKEIFWLPQHFDPGNGTVGGFLDSIFSLKYNQKIKPTDDEMVELFTKLLLPDNILDRKTEQLSGGQLQRVGLGIGLMINRPLVLLDEPTSQLDDKTKEKVAEEYLSRDDMTLISASHDPAWISHANKRIQL